MKLTHRKNWGKSVEGQGPKIFHDSHYITCKNWLAILHLEGKMYSENRKNETTVYLNFSPKTPIEYQIPIHSAVSLKNNSNFDIFNVSIFSIKAQREVFSLKELPSHKVMQLEFVREGFYSLFYSFAGNQNAEGRWIKIVPKPPERTQIPHNQGAPVSS